MVEPLPQDSQAPTPALEGDDPFASMMERFDEAAALLGLAPDAYMVLRRPDREFKFVIPVEYEDGSLKVHHGYRIRHNLSLGPCLGGLRLDGNMKRAELRALAGWTTWKCAALNVPFGGSMGGVDFDPSNHDQKTIEKVVRRYTSGVLDLIGPERDILYPDLNATEQVMAWALDTYSMHARHTENAVVVGKPLGLGGSTGRRTAIGRCTRVLMETRLKAMNFSGKAKVAVQGAGIVGAQVMRELDEHGHLITAVSDFRGAVYNEDGIDVEDLLRHRRRTGSVLDFDGGDSISPDELLSCSCDVLIPAATARQITRKNADSIRASLIVEAANGPTTRMADQILSDRGIPVVPDLLGNAGSILIAYFEWVQNRMGYAWPKEVIEERLDRMVLDAYHRARKVAGSHKVGLRLATCMLGVERVAYFDRLRGIYA